MKLWDLDCELLRDVGSPHRKRKLPQPMASLVYDHHYELLSKAHLIRWVQVDPVYQSLSDDHYVLTERGYDVLRRMKTEYPPIEVPDDV